MRSIAADARSSLPFRRQIFPERLANDLKLNRFHEFAARFTELVAFRYPDLRKLGHQFVGCVRIEGEAPVLEGLHYGGTGRIAAQSFQVHAWPQFFREQIGEWL